MLIIEKYYFESSDIIKFVYSLYEDKFGESFSKDITKVLFWKRNYALTAPKRLNPEYMVDNQVFLAAEPLSWCQIIYQLGHEFSHLSMSCYPDNDNLKWISECLCGAASIYSLKKSVDFFEKTNPSYAKSVEKYIEDILNKSPWYSKAELKNYISDKITELKKDPINSETEDRPRNEVIRKHWAKIIEENEDGWSAISLFSEIDDKKMNENSFLKEWYLKCRNESEQKFVRCITETIL